MRNRTLENNINTFIFIITIINPDAKKRADIKTRKKWRECVYILYWDKQKERCKQDTI